DKFTKCMLDKRCCDVFLDPDDEYNDDDDKGNVNLDEDILPLLIHIVPELK
ncbi:hypothetical protein HDU98_003691, partial [Podochytrium sp. JEL0797]